MGKKGESKKERKRKVRKDGGLRLNTAAADSSFMATTGGGGLSFQGAKARPEDGPKILTMLLGKRRKTDREKVGVTKTVRRDKKENKKRKKEKGLQKKLRKTK